MNDPFSRKVMDDHDYSSNSTLKPLKKTAILVILLCCLYQIQGQTNFLPGYIITNANDTLHGLIDYRSDIRNSKRCEFKENKNAPVQEFLPFSILEYRYTDSKYYISKMLTVNGQQIPVFIEFLVNGISDLYYYHAETGIAHYYIEKKDGQFYELTNELRHFQRNGKDYTSFSNKYIGLLKLAFADCEQLYPMINAAKLEDKSLIALTKKYHDYECDGEKCIIYEKQLPLIRVRLGVFGSMNGSVLKITRDPLYEAIDFKTSTYPAIGLLLNTTLPRASERLSFQLSGEYAKPYYYGTGTSPENSAMLEEVHLHTSVVKVKAGFKYTYPKGKIRPTILVGGNLIKMIKSDGRRIEDILIQSTATTNVWRDVPVTELLWGPVLEAGIDLHLTASLVPFLTLGYEKSAGKNNFLSQSSTSNLINTLNLHAGIYF